MRKESTQCIVHNKVRSVWERWFTNELGNRILMYGYFEDDGSVTLEASGPHSRMEHTWTRKEAEKLHDLLTYMLGVKP